MDGQWWGLGQNEHSQRTEPPRCRLISLPKGKPLDPESYALPLRDTCWQGDCEIMVWVADSIYNALQSSDRSPRLFIWNFLLIYINTLCGSFTPSLSGLTARSKLVVLIFGSLPILFHVECYFYALNASTCVLFLCIVYCSMVHSISIKVCERWVVVICSSHICLLCVYLLCYVLCWMNAINILYSLVWAH